MLWVHPLGYKSRLSRQDFHDFANIQRMQVAVILAGVPFFFDFRVKEMCFGDGDGGHFFTEAEEICFVYIGSVVPKSYCQAGGFEFVLDPACDNSEIF